MQVTNLKFVLMNLVVCAVNPEIAAEFSFDDYGKLALSLYPKKNVNCCVSMTSVILKSSRKCEIGAVKCSCICIHTAYPEDITIYVYMSCLLLLISRMSFDKWKHLSVLQVLTVIKHAAEQCLRCALVMKQSL